MIRSWVHFEGGRNKSRITLSIKQLEEDPLLETLEKVIPQDGSADSDGNSDYVIEPLQLLETIVQELYARGGSRRRKVGVSDLNEPLPVENLEHLVVVALSVGSRIPVVHDGPGTCR
ncbi:hypothetical protein Tco_0865967, partial [Tanacetum coccineum]